MGFTGLPDSVLLQRWKDGDEQVLNTLFNRLDKAAKQEATIQNLRFKISGMKKKAHKYF